jgi:hypothetical protein
MFDAFEEVKSARVKTLVDAVLAGDVAESRRLAAVIVREDEMMCQATVLVCQRPKATRQDVLDLIRRTTDPEAVTPLTAWERLLSGSPV